MSRHRSPGGRNAHPRPVLNAAAVPGAQAPRPARHRAARESAVRNGMAAAAAAGGALVVTVPMANAPVSPAAADTYLRSTAAETDDLRMIASVVPVTASREVEPPELDVSDLVKAAGLFEEARALAERQAAANCDADLSDIGRVKPWVRSAARFLSCLYDEPDLIGVAQRARASDHPKGLALDLMVRGDKGDRIAKCALANQEELGVDYVIWRQRVNYGDGWERMADRGGITENHYDHVHISFKRGAGGGGAPLVARCS
ncbi:hypothetical protein K1T35_41295 [Pseudonocardia sp. DSM 110487]|uniref:hypothetical protein n=1 Tax=Pseudonocardia sp. DSM 110487 TaxID=2865833 RepID=UPI001C694AC5|nr:hypothetical protein [Pseudonocardia sp. DSM 110487]QYN34747.1 hypothetical protein K1T35_41295 [Pseudonocardia sp. DSM 110487]